MANEQKSTRNNQGNKRDPARGGYKINKTNFLAALKGTGGIISTVAQKMGLERTTVYNFLNKFPDMEEARNQEREKIVDICENNVFNMAQAGDWDANKFLLNKLGKNRGYADKQEVSHSFTEPIKISVSGIKKK